MLIPQTADSRAKRRQGSPRVGLAELRRALRRPSRLGDVHRHRLQELARRAATVAALGDEYAGVCLSSWATSGLTAGTAA